MREEYWFFPTQAEDNGMVQFLLNFLLELSYHCASIATDE